jgi:hypothetical protein
VHNMRIKGTGSKLYPRFIGIVLRLQQPILSFGAASKLASSNLCSYVYLQCIRYGKHISLIDVRVASVRLSRDRQKIPRSTSRSDIDGSHYRADVLLSRKARSSEDSAGIRSSMDAGYEMDEKYRHAAWELQTRSIIR